MSSLSIKKIKDISIILTCLSVTLGMVLGILTLRKDYKQVRLAGLEQAKRIFDDEDKIKATIYKIMTTGNWPKIDMTATNKQQGWQIYYSSDLDDFRAICHHYERVGALISADYLDFNLYSDIVAFPEDFYKNSETLRKYLRANWNGQGKSLPDFLINFDKLHAMYQARRGLQ